MTYSSSKKLEIVSRLIEQRIPAQMAYRLMGLKERSQTPDIILNQGETLEAEDNLISDYRRYKPKNTVVNKNK